MRNVVLLITLQIASLVFSKYILPQIKLQPTNDYIVDYLIPEYKSVEGEINWIVIPPKTKNESCETAAYIFKNSGAIELMPYINNNQINHLEFYTMLTNREPTKPGDGKNNIFSKNLDKNLVDESVSGEMLCH